MGVPRRYYADRGTNFIPESAHSLNVAITVAALVVAPRRCSSSTTSSRATSRQALRRQPVERHVARMADGGNTAAHGNFGKDLPVVYRWAYDYSVPGVKVDFIPQTYRQPTWLRAGGPSP